MIMTVRGQTAEDSGKLAELLTDVLQSFTEDISADGFPHQLLLQRESSRTMLDTELLEQQNGSLEMQNTLKEEITAAEEALASLKEPARSHSSVGALAKTGIKYGILGLALGMLLGMIAVMLNYLFRNRVETSRQMEETTGLPFLGSLVKHTSYWDRTADRILGERTWTDPEQAAAYFQENVKIRMEGKHSAVVFSNCKLQETEESVQTIIKLLKSQGLQVCYVGDAVHAPETAACLKKSDCAILLERLGETHWTAVEELLNTAEEIKAQVIGFVTA